jgi:hypothetical protein
MLALEVVLNGNRIAVAGADDLNVLNGMVTAVGKLGRKASGTKAQPKGYDIRLSVGGLTGRQGGIPNEHVRWEEMKKLKVGDEVLIRVLRARVADPPNPSIGADPKHTERNERQEFKWVRSRYLKLRRKYERTQTIPRSKER